MHLFEQKRFCEAKGVEKALELIDIYEDINAKD
jgi:peroxiredoxin